LLNNRSLPKAVIFGLKNTTLSAEEREFFRRENPLGFILFARNCESPEQISALTRELRDCVGREELPILIDQEGGRVARLKPPHFRASYPAGIFASLAAQDKALAEKAVILNSKLIAHELASLGITVNCAPVADLLFEDAHSIIGDRSFGTTPEQVALLAGATSAGLIAGGIVPIMKHIPGHGRAKVDSHEKLPVISTAREQLDETDFKIFSTLRTIPWAMTAHIIYSAIDPDQPVTLSAKMIRMIREELGFNGILISDDLSMKALAGDFATRTTGSFAAGCDLVLHCNGDMDEMLPIAAHSPAISAHVAELLAAGYAINKNSLALSPDESEHHLHEILHKIPSCPTLP
jgi:beta-N-acetylhexosaminidase